ncbi:GAF domain-containing protein [Anaerolineales bacterium HSG25]|nr:GAF domain-containing protein [Anaerolineales bacterium HSG25]
MAQLNQLYKIGLVIGSNYTLPDALSALYQEIDQLIDTSNFTVALYDEPNGQLQFPFAYSLGRPHAKFATPINPRGLITHTITTQNTMIIQDLSKINRAVIEIDTLFPPEAVCSWLSVPIPNLIQPLGMAQGAIVLWSDQPNRFTNRELLILSAIANQTAVPLRYVQMFESLHYWAMKTAIINDVAQMLASTSSNLGQVLYQVLEQVENLFDVDICLLFLADSSGDLAFQLAIGMDINTDIEAFVLSQTSEMVQQIISTKEPIILQELTSEARLIEHLQERLGVTIETMLCAPLIIRDEMIGLLQVLNKKEGKFVQRDLEVIESIMPFTAVAIENARLHQRVMAERNRVVEVDEQARKELARNLHDGPTQIVTTIMTRLNFCQDALQKEPELIPDEISYMQQKASEAIHQMRTMMFELRPLVLETDGLAAALDVFIERRRHEIKDSKLVLKIKPETPGGKISRQETKVEMNLFAVVQEAVNNAVKYAQAKNIIVQLTETPEAVYTIVADDGRGFDLQFVLGNYAKRTSLGMVNIQERSDLIGAELEIKSAPGMGTHIFVCVSKTDNVASDIDSAADLLQFPLKRE